MKIIIKMQQVFTTTNQQLTIISASTKKIIPYGLSLCTKHSKCKDISKTGKNVAHVRLPYLLQFTKYLK